MLYRYFIKISYKGTRYHGWQMQRNAVSVQEQLNKALSSLLGENIDTMGCGRTDTGVHACEFYAHFDCSEGKLPIRYCIYKLNKILPDDIAVQEIHSAPSRAHARYDALSRTYKYYIIRKKDPFWLGNAYYFYGELDWEQMNAGAQLLLNYKDFSCFSKSHTQVGTNLCAVYEAKWEAEGDLFIFTICADRFLRNMVRAIVGTLLQLGKGRLNLEQVEKIIESKNRNRAGASVPACGLYLVKVEYPENLFKKEGDHALIRSK